MNARLAVAGGVSPRARSCAGPRAGRVARCRGRAGPRRSRARSSWWILPRRSPARDGAVLHDEPRCAPGPRAPTLPLAPVSECPARSIVMFVGSDRDAALAAPPRSEPASFTVQGTSIRCGSSVRRSRARSAGSWRRSARSGNCGGLELTQQPETEFPVTTFRAAARSEPDPRAVRRAGWAWPGDVVVGDAIRAAEGGLIPSVVGWSLQSCTRLTRLPS